MKIIITSWRDLAHPNAGGSERYVDDVATGLTRRGHDITVLAGGPVEPHDYAIVDTGSTYGQYLRAPMVYLRHHRDADLVIDVQNGVPFWSPAWRRGPKLCVVHHVHTDQWSTRFPRPLAFAGSQLEVRGFPRAYRNVPFVAVSPSTAKALEQLGVDQTRVRVVPNAVRPAPEPVPEHAEPRFVVLGRLVPHKRVDLALDVWKQVRPVTGGQLVIVGDGPERAILERRADRDVTFLGSVDEATKYRVLSEAWLLIHPAMHEGWGIVITEAGQQRTPTVAFDVPGVRDSVRDGETGLLATDAESLVASWLALADDDARRARLGEQARQHSMAYTVERTVDQFEEACFDAVAPTAYTTSRARGSS